MLGNRSLPQIGGGAVGPNSITGLQLWLDFTDLSKMFQDTAGSSPVATAGQSIARINDKSANANNFTQATAAKRPAYQSGGGALFDGGDVLVGGATGLNATSKTVVVKWKPVSFPGTHVLFTGASTNYYVGHSSAGVTQLSWQNAAAAQKTQTGASYTIGTTSIHSARWSVAGSDVTVKQRLDGVDIANTAYADGMATPTATAYYLGGYGSTPVLPINGVISHILVYNRSLSDVEIAALEAML